MKPVLSIVVPVYKVEKYLNQCVDSILKALAEHKNKYEIILVDDGSPDNCPAMCDEYAAKHKQIKVIHKENGGLSDARNVGILQASGEYIVLLDSDDKFSDCNALRNLFALIREHKTDLIVNDWITFSDNDHEEKLPKNKYHKNMGIVLPNNLVYKFDLSPAWALVAAREYLLKNNLFFKKGIFHEDAHWCPRVLFSTNRIAINHSPFYAYRENRKGSITASLSPKNVFDMLSIMDELFEWSKDKNRYGKDGCKYMLWKIKSLFRPCLLRSMNTKWQSENEYRSFCKKLQNCVWRIPFFYLKRPFSLLSVAFLGVNNTIILLRLYIKMRRGK